jgi:nucleotide-binding universal stress UspA family protein
LQQVRLFLSQLLPFTFTLEIEEDQYAQAALMANLELAQSGADSVFGMLENVMIHKILVAIDRSDMSRLAFDQALSLATALNAELMLLHVLSHDEPDSPRLQPIVYEHDHPSGLSQALRESFEREWNDFVQQYSDLLKMWTGIALEAGVKAEFKQEPGKPGKQICTMAAEWGADLIVIGSHCRRGLKELLLGSISNYVMHHAPCSVFVVHPHKLEPQQRTPEAEAVLA